VPTWNRGNRSAMCTAMGFAGLSLCIFHCRFGV
jgi:hypothetical protein